LSVEPAHLPEHLVNPLQDELLATVKMLTSCACLHASDSICLAVGICLLRFLYYELEAGMSAVSLVLLANKTQFKNNENLP
jgi:hypothetical protein